MTAPILFIAFQTSSRANGGLESLTQILRRIEPQPIVITQCEGPYTDIWRRVGCDVRLVPVPEPRARSGVSLLRDRAARLPAFAATNAAAARIVRRSGVGVVHCNDPSALFFGGLGARAAGAKVILNLRDTRAGREYGAKWRVMRHCADVIVVLSHEMRREIVDHVPPLAATRRAAEVLAVYSAVDVGRMTPVGRLDREEVRRRLGIPAEEFAVVCPGTFNDKKNQLGLIERGAPRLVGHGARLYFVGDFSPKEDQYAARCEEAVTRLKLQQTIRFVGFTEAVADWYRAADTVCLASRNEGLARGMIEALACGTPVVSFDVSSAREILEAHECGLVAAQGDYDALAAGILALAADPDRRLSCGARGASTARKLFDPDRSVAQYVALYHRLGARSARMRSSSSA